MPDETTRIDPGTAALDGTLLAPRTLLLHTYEVERLLARGGMGEVYLVRHCELATRHAIKIIRPQLSGTEAAIDLAELFRREAAALSSVRHDAVVGYEGFFRDGKRTSYLVMEYVAGPSLAEVLRARSLGPDEVYRLRDRVAGGLAAAHARGVTHRDLSPDNIILPGGEVELAKVIDFGIAKRADSGVTTIIGQTFAGKLRFAAPEQLGLYGGTVGPAADIYSLALVLAAAAGTPLAMGDSLAGAVEARLAVPDLKPVPPWLRPQLASMLAPDPTARPASLGEVLRRWPRPAVPLKGAAAPSAGPRRRRGVLILSVAGALALALVWLGARVLGPPGWLSPPGGQEAPPAARFEPPAAPTAALPAPPAAPTPQTPPAEPPASATVRADPPPAQPAPARVPVAEAAEAKAEVPPPSAPLGARTSAARSPVKAQAEPGAEPAEAPRRPASRPPPRADRAVASARCQDLLLKAQLGEPLSGVDRATLAGCR